MQKYVKKLTTSHDIIRVKSSVPILNNNLFFVSNVLYRFRQGVNVKKNNEIRESIVSSANNILGDDILDHQLRREKLVALSDAYCRASNEAAKAKKELVDCYVFTSAVNRYEAYIEAITEGESYKLFNFYDWK